MLFVVATPIGHLEDLTPRARATLAEADVIAAEDTRHTRKLLSHCGIEGKRLVSYHDHNEEARAEALVDEILETGIKVCLVSDAGTPCISDPGYRLVRLAKERGVKVVPVPGPSALTALASAAGLATDRLLFVGFLPVKTSAIEAEVSSWASARASVVFYESLRRLVKSLAVVKARYPQARIAIGRELTKVHEEIVTLPIEESLAWLSSSATLKGEVAVMVEPNAASVTEQGVDRDGMIRRAKAAFADGATLKDLLRDMSGEGLKRAELYQLLLEAKTTD